MTHSKATSSPSSLRSSESVCPRCGYCPTCGRGNQGLSPFYPIWPIWPQYPWYTPIVTFTSGTNVSATLASGGASTAWEPEGVFFSPTSSSGEAG